MIYSTEPVDYNPYTYGGVRHQSIERQLDARGRLLHASVSSFPDNVPSPCGDGRRSDFLSHDIKLGSASRSDQTLFFDFDASHTIGGDHFLAGTNFGNVRFVTQCTPETSSSGFR